MTLRESFTVYYETSVTRQLRHVSPFLKSQSTFAWKNTIEVYLASVSTKCFLHTVVVRVQTSTMLTKTALRCKESIPAALLPPNCGVGSLVSIASFCIHHSEHVGEFTRSRKDRGCTQEIQSDLPSNSRECHLAINPTSLWLFSIWRNYSKDIVTKKMYSLWKPHGWVMLGW